MPILGDEDFIQKIAVEYGDTSTEVRFDERQLFRPLTDRIIQVVSEVYEVAPSELLKVEKGRGKKTCPERWRCILRKDKAVIA